MRVLGACSLGGAGHWEPLLTLLDAARRRGHETLVVAPPALESMVETTAHRYLRGGEPPESAVARIRERLPVVPAAEAAVLGNRELFGRLATAAMLPATERVITEWRPDLVVREPCEYASAVVAARRGVATAQVAIGLAEVEWDSIDIAAPALEAFQPGLPDALRDVPYLSRFPDSLDPSRFRDTRRFREPATAPPRPLPDWWNGSGAALIYVSFGTVLGHMSFAAEAYRTVLRAVAGIDARVLLTVGRWFDSSQLASIPDNVHVEAWVDQADVLGEADVVVSHGGSGTTFGALAAGVPVVVVPLFADQFANGRQVARSGAGAVLDTGRDRDDPGRPLEARDAPRVAEAIASVRSHRSFREAARRVAKEMAAVPIVDTLFDALAVTG